MKKIKSLFKRDYTHPDRLVYNEPVQGSEWVLNGEGVATYKWDGTSCLIRDGQLFKRYDRKLKFGKALKRQGYYTDFINIGSTVSKTSRKPFKNGDKQDHVIAIKEGFEHTGQPYAVLTNNPNMDLRQLKPVGVTLPERFYRNAPDNWEAAETKPNIHTGHWPGWIPVGDEPESKWHRAAMDNTLPNDEDTLRDGTYELIGEKVNSNKHRITGHMLVPHGHDELEHHQFFTTPPRTFDELNQWFSENELEGIVWWHPDGRMVKIKRSDFGYEW